MLIATNRVHHIDAYVDRDTSRRTIEQLPTRLLVETNSM